MKLKSESISCLFPCQTWGGGGIKSYESHAFFSLLKQVLGDLQQVCDKDGSTLVLVNHQFFIDPFSPKEAAAMIDSMEQVESPYP